MRSRRRAMWLALALLASGSGLARAEPGEGSLQPYQMVRSLQLVQDRIADGDHAALPMQKKLLELTDMRLRTARTDEFYDRRNVHALMVYAMSGGNPATVADSFARLGPNDEDRAAGDGILGYLTGDVARAREAMRSVDPSRQPPEVAAFLYLVKGSVLATDDATAAMTMLDRARLLGPGTLVEEAALRRSVALAVAKGDGAHFMSAAEQYARRYLRSPYSSQFAEAFVSGIIELNGKLDLGEVERTIDWMSREQARAVYLRLARRAAIDGDATLLDFASRKASQYPPAGIEEEDPRSELYSSISSVTSETVEDVLSRLRDLDSARLSAADRALLAAAKAVAAEVVAPVEPRQAKPAPQPADIATEAPAPDAFADEAASTDDIVTSARARLEAVDKLLQETKR